MNQSKVKFDDDAGIICSSGSTGYPRNSYTK